VIGSFFLIDSSTISTSEDEEEGTGRKRGSEGDLDFDMGVLLPFPVPAMSTDWNSGIEGDLSKGVTPRSSSRLLSSGKNNGETGEFLSGTGVS
jgi:hypothetical protein